MNDDARTGTPLGYPITFRRYGTWLPGDERGAVDKFNNKYGAPFLPPNEKWRRFAESRLNHAPVKLTASMRTSAETAIRETCEMRRWRPCAVNVRTNHIHLAAEIGNGCPKRALSAFKANATRKMRADGCWPHPHSPWSAHGSRRYLWAESDLERAIEYVVDRQGGKL